MKINSVTEIIFHPQVFVTENVGPILNLLCLAANDPDSGQNGNITYSITSGTGPFSIDPVHGLLSAKESLDYEQQSLHRLVVQAADNGVPSRKVTTKVEILVQDANDAPVFSQDHYTGLLYNYHLLLLTTITISLLELVYHDQSAHNGVGQLGFNTEALIIPCKM